MDKNLIYKHLKSHYNAIKNNEYEILFLALQGSQNYNLDDENSDVDSIAVVLPKYDDLILGNFIETKTYIMPNNEHVDIIDLRTIKNFWIKQNTHFLQILFTDYKLINRKYRDLIELLYNLNEDIAKINYKHLFHNIKGLSQQCHKTYQDIFEDSLYNGKKAYHIIRFNYLLTNLYNGLSYKESLCTFPEEVYMIINKIKRKIYDFKEARKFIEMCYEDTINKIDTYLFNLALDKPILLKNNEDIILKLNTLIKNIINSYIEDYFNIKLNNNNIDINKYQNVFVTSDLHFGHTNILDYEQRKDYMNIKTLQEHDKFLIDRWNSVVHKNDLVIILGDLSFYKGYKTTSILNKLNGYKLLIKGNHDECFLKNKTFDKNCFIGVYDYLETNYKGTKLCLMHYPISHFRHMGKPENGYLLIHGHIHSQPFEVPRHSFNAGADVNNYYPINIKQAIKYALENKNGMINHRFNMEMKQ